MASAPLLRAVAVTRRFGAFTALDHVDFALEPGSIHALLGENGAGKSTLMHILSGQLRPTEGGIERDGQPLQLASPVDAARAGIGMVHQHFLLVPSLTVAENLLIGAHGHPGPPWSYPLGAVLTEAKALADRLGWRIPWNEPAGEIPVGDQQRIEILKALRGDTRVLICDEPTAVLTPTETPELFKTLRQLSREGRGIVFISHKLDEVMELADTVTVLRRGRIVLRTAAADTDAQSLAVAMVGSESDAAARLAARPEQRARPVAESPVPGIAVDDLGILENGRKRLEGIGFTVAPGEILAVAGVDGNGQEELVDCLSGMRRPTTGTIRYAGTVVADPGRSPDPRRVRAAGVGIVPADRQRRGLALDLSIAENMLLAELDSPEVRRGPFVRWAVARARAAERIARYDIRAGGATSRCGSLSGGNQQKVVLACALAGDPPALVVVNPTRGLDIGAIATMHDALRAARDRGAAILLVTTELDEAVALGDRVAVLFEGRLRGIVPPDTPREHFGALMGGAR
ncbi:MAG: ABC transporter ATP-binding protein [Armatimonadota bacterium]